MSHEILSTLEDPFFTVADGMSPPSPAEPQARLVDWSALEIRLLWAYEGKPDVGGRRGIYATENPKAWLLRRGNVEIEENGQVIQAAAGQWLLGGPGQDRRRFSRDAEILSVSFHMSWPDGAYLYENEPIQVLKAKDFPELEQTAAALRDFVEKHFPRARIALPSCRSDAHLFIRLQKRLLDWTEAFFTTMAAIGVQPRRLGIVDERVRRVLGLLDTWPLESALDRQEIARTAGLTIQHLDRLFLKHMGVTPACYFSNRRMEQARHCLGDASMQVKEIAYRLGFLSMSHFSRWFKQRQRISPQQFRSNQLPG